MSARSSKLRVDGNKLKKFLLIEVVALHVRELIDTLLSHLLSLWILQVSRVEVLLLTLHIVKRDDTSTDIEGWLLNSCLNWGSSHCTSKFWRNKGSWSCFWGWFGDWLGLLLCLLIGLGGGGRLRLSLLGLRLSLSVSLGL